MASHYKLYDGLGETVPFNAKYTYPTQANRAWKQNIKIPTTNGGTFRPGGSNPQITLPAQGYLNTRNSFISFDVTFDTLPDTYTNVRFQNNIQSIFNRMLLRYGSLSLEDLRETGPLIRLLTDNTMTGTTAVVDQNAIAEGVGGTIATLNVRGTGDHTGTDEGSNPIVDLHNARVRAIQCGGLYKMGGSNGTDGTWPAGAGRDEPRRYMVQLPFGLFQQNKLLPLKWMASQLTIELALASFEECCCSDASAGPIYTNGYKIDNLNFNAELLEFDGSYDAAILEGLRGPGLPIKFSSWNTYVYPAGPKSNTLQVPERNRSLKAVFAVQVGPKQSNLANTYPVDSHALLQSSNSIVKGSAGGGKGILESYQFRIGGKYYPAQPVVCGTNGKSNGAAEAYTELSKALNIVGDYRLSTGQNPLRWSRMSGNDANNRKGFSNIYDWPTDRSSKYSPTSSAGPSSFAIGLDLETSSGAEVSGLNGEEQNDLSVMLYYSDAQSQDCQHIVYVYYDALLVLRENNLVELIK